MSAGSAQSFQVPADMAGKRLDDVLERLVPGLSRARLQKLVRRGGVQLDGKRVTRSNGSVRGGESLRVEGAPPAPAASLVVHEDASFLIVDKPAGLLTHPAPRSEAPSVSEVLAREYALPSFSGEERPGIVHRLDRETSGLLVVARSERAGLALQEQFRERSVEKTYLALVSHVPTEEAFEVALALGPVPGKADRQGVCAEGEGKPAETRFARVEAFAQHALLACSPRTGRRHQIRVHLAHEGLPVVGDPLYGTKRQLPLPRGCPKPRLLLHAWKLAFAHPEDGSPQAFEAPWPADLRALVERLRRPS